MIFNFARVPEQVEIKKDLSHFFYHWGANNVYPQTIRQAGKRSATAAACLKKYASFIFGAGPNEPYKKGFFVNDNETISLIAKQLSEQISLFGACALHIEVNDLNLPVSLKTIPFQFIRHCSEELKNYVAISDNWALESKEHYSTKIKYLPLYSTISPARNKEMRDQHFQKTKQDFKGFVYLFQLDSLNIYPEPILGTCYSDVLSEMAASLFRESTSKNGFLPSLWAFFNDDLSDKNIKAIVNQLKANQGAQNAGKVLLMGGARTDEQGRVQLPLNFVTPPKLDGSIMENQETRSEMKIIRAFNIPKFLIALSSDSLFSDSGAVLKEALKWYSKETAHERESLSSFIDDILGLFLGSGMLPPFELNPLNFGEEIIINDSDSIGSDDDETARLQAQAQANLRGTVGGVQGILEILNNLKDGVLTEQIAKNMLIVLYGYDEETAQKLIKS